MDNQNKKEEEIDGIVFEKKEEGDNIPNTSPDAETEKRLLMEEGIEFLEEDSK